MVLATGKATGSPTPAEAEREGGIKLVLAP